MRGLRDHNRYGTSSDITMNITAEEIIAKTQRAFAGVQLGSGVSLLEAEVIDAYGSDKERAAARALDELCEWKKIPDEKLARYYGFSFMDAEGMRFHLPAYMCFAVRKADDADLPDSIEFFMNELDNDACKNELFVLLNKEQAEMVGQFLEFLAWNEASASAGIGIDGSLVPDKHLTRVARRWREFYCS